jgi:siroheme synthase-like protein
MFYVMYYRLECNVRKPRGLGEEIFMKPYYPVFLDLNARSCVVIGGGVIAEGKIAMLIECGANITMISPTVTDRIKNLAGTGMINLEEREYQEGDLKEAYLVIAATDDNNVNQTVAREAQQHNLLLNVADVTHLCNFIAPAVVRRGDVTVAISTSGTSPALARKLREELENCSLRCVDPFLDYADLSTMLAEVRLFFKAQGLRIAPDHWQKCLNRDILNIYNEDKDKAKEMLIKSLHDGVLGE